MSNPTAPFEDQIDLKELFKFFRSNLIWLFVNIFLFALLAFLYGQFSQHFFQSKSKFITKTSKTQSSSSLGGLASLAGIDMQNQSNFDPSLYFSEIIDDDEFLKSVLDHRWKFQNDSMKLENIWKITPDTTPPNWQYIYSKKMTAKLKTGHYIFLEKNKVNGVITLTTLFEDADLAFQVNAYIIDLLGNYLFNTLKTQARQKRIFIASRIDAVEISLRESEDQLVKFQQQNADVSRPNLLMERVRLSRSVKMNEELLFQLSKEFEMAKLEELRDQPLIEIISKPTISIYREKPNKKSLLFLGILAGTLVGLFSLCGKFWYSKL